MRVTFLREFSSQNKFIFLDVLSNGKRGLLVVICCFGVVFCQCYWSLGGFWSFSHSSLRDLSSVDMKVGARRFAILDIPFPMIPSPIGRAPVCYFNFECANHLFFLFDHSQRACILDFRIDNEIGRLENILKNDPS